MNKRIIMAITGASGSIYAIEFLKIMEDLEVEVHGIISEAGEKVLAIELDKTGKDLGPVHKWHDINDFTSPTASGSNLFDGMVVLPCTMGTLSAIANGTSDNLIHRAAALFTFDSSANNICFAIELAFLPFLSGFIYT